MPSNLEGKIFIDQQTWITPEGKIHNTNLVLREEDDVPHYCFSPDGLQIAYCDNDNLWLVNLVSQERISLFSFDEQGYKRNFIRYSPDGRSLSFIKNIDEDTGQRRTDYLCILDLNSKRIKQLPIPCSIPNWYMGGYPPHFSCSSGAELIFFNDLLGTIYCYCNEMNEVQPFARGLCPEVSSDGEKLLYVYNDFRPTIYVNHISSNDLAEIQLDYMTEKARLWMCSWSPSGGHIAYALSEQHSPGMKVGIVSINGAFQKNIFQGDSFLTLQWVR